MTRRSALALAAGASAALAIDNGLGLVPPMGFSSWLAFSSAFGAAKQTGMP
jgi:hypothetical protein